MIEIPSLFLLARETSRDTDLSRDSAKVRGVLINETHVFFRKIKRPQNDIYIMSRIFF